MENVLSEETLLQVQELLTVYGLKIIAALAIFIIGKMIAKSIKSGVIKAMKKGGSDPILISFTTNIIYTALLAFVIIASLGQLGIQTTSFIAIIGAAGLAIGLALQGSLANFAAGVLMIIFRPFKKGDFIEGAGASGIIEEVHIFNTVMRTGDNKTIIIPNGSLMGGNIVNYSTKPTRRLDLVIGIGYDDDIKKAKSVLDELMQNETRILKDPAPTIGLLELGDSSVNFAVRPWVNSADYWGVHFDLLESIKLRFDSEGISIPYPQQDIHVHNTSDDK
ncbi:MAG: small conductance mechanosensitive channel [Cycloclasticus pugetii]|jgi:small conductance mechanosensitive channel|uniref:Small-conductance mechanosensitive channel n=2 Tax=Cycloclasticus TaxID=34067 RepID=S5T402_9GAMM|nr:MULTISPECIES: mechanosensitive ion channel domain-containing protein [Cycloclasticus]AGS38516.1 Mechanosensitive ion channel protein [Cycloclasticus zancles 78-ME]ATI02017.1 mechanosensitive ion channel family protein [Cycloclasticus sp. PY97N]EPD13240.1 transporter [Cycloclasticus pugetii]MBV1899370.1 mechanosensitive ion channel [Cycloclasticus sp.]MDF1829430.1 mechanosensitive ion channel [Cycloclasticus pugetii]|tara:strand:+ start:3490 stop:4323 length:834 start_codon:yes stop_codon:yes gene_type:complete